MRRGFLFQDVGIFENLWILISRDREFWQLWDFYPGRWGFLYPGFKGMGTFYTLYFWVREFSGMRFFGDEGFWECFFFTGYPNKKPPLVISVLACFYNQWNLPGQYFRRTHVHQLFTVDFVHNFVKTQAIQILGLFPEKTFIQRNR